jgi:putative ABC transport system permease protein
MLLHDLRLALLSFRRNPILTALTVGAIAAGIGAAMITVTLYHARGGHPIWWKEQRLFAVTLDARSTDPQATRFERHPEYPPFQVTYRDAQALYRSDIPQRAVRMFRSLRVVDPGRKDLKPFAVMGRVATADFFAMFDVPFLYGSGWSRSADETPEPVVVLGRHMNEKLFGGANSLGRSVTLSGKQYRVVGVTDAWMPQPKFYDMSSGGAFDVAEDFYLPFGWGPSLELMPYGNMNCLTVDTKIGTYRELLNAECVWLQYWVELPDAARRARFQQFVDNYVTDQKHNGRFPRPLNNRIVDVNGWLAMNDVIGEESRAQVALALMFLAVCVLNTLGLMLAKFLGAAPVTGLRRALGASRRDIVRQHLTEVIVVALAGGVVGAGLAWVGLRAIRVLTYVPDPSGNPDRLALSQALVHMDMKMLLLAAAVAVVTGIVAGAYPAWRIGRMAPAVFLKTQ